MRRGGRRMVGEEEEEGKGGEIGRGGGRKGRDKGGERKNERGGRGGESALCIALHTCTLGMYSVQIHVLYVPYSVHVPVRVQTIWSL